MEPPVTNNDSRGGGKESFPRATQPRIANSTSRNSKKFKPSGFIALLDRHHERERYARIVICR
jgi:hypothetical protein